MLTQANILLIKAIFVYLSIVGVLITNNCSSGFDLELKIFDYYNNMKFNISLGLIRQRNHFVI